MEKSSVLDGMQMLVVSF